MGQEATSYDASHIQALQGWEAIRKRPGMYIGSTSERGLRHMVFEVAERAVNEVLSGVASRVDVVLTPDGGVCVVDDGPGIPVDEANGTGLESLLTRMSFGMAPRGRDDVTVGFASVGLSVVNALSHRLTVEVQRDGARWVQEYARGIATTPLTKTGPSTGHGTTIAFWPDPEIFDTVEFSFDPLAERFRELAFLNRALEISLSDRRRPPKSASVRFQFPGGTHDFVAYLDGQSDLPTAEPGHPEIIGFEQEDERMAGTMEVALRWRGSGEQKIRSFANSRPTPGGGTHEVGFRAGVAAATNAFARKHQLLAGADPDLSTDRICDGLTAVVSVKLDHPEFVGSTRDVLGTIPVHGCVSQAVEEHLGRWLEGHPERAAAIVASMSRGARQR